MYERIVVPLDGSRRAERIIPLAVDFFHAPDVELDLVVVVDMQGRVEYTTVPITCSGHLANHYLAGMAAVLERQGMKVRTSVKFGRAAAAILDHAHESHATLIAMSTHGRTGIERLVRGSVAESVLRGASVPVFLARTGVPDERPLRRTLEGSYRILVPLDGSPGSESVLPLVRHIASRGRAEIELLRVTETIPPPALSPYGHLSGIAWSSRADAYLRAVSERFRAEGIEAIPRSMLGSPAERILERANSGAVQLVAMSTHGYSGLRRMVMGSVAEEVLRSMTVPLLATRILQPAPIPSGA